MIFNYFIMVWGVIDFILGISILLGRRGIIKFVFESFLILNKGNRLSNNIKNIKNLSKWLGEIVILEGALYIFLASASIFFRLRALLVIVFIIFIEFFFFSVINKGIKDFIE